MKGRLLVPYTRYEVLVLSVFYLTFMSLAVPGFVSAANLQLSWIDNSQDEDGFHVERKLGTGGTFALIATTGPNVTSYGDSNLADNTTYCYRVNAFNSAGDSAYANEACATTSTSISSPPPTTAPAPSGSPPPVSATVTATLLGQTGEDIAGTTSETPDGIKDDHIRLNGVQSPVTGVKITDNGGCCAWQTPYNSRGDWIVAIRPQTDPSIVDLYFDAWQLGASYTVNLTFADGSSQTVQTSSSTAAASSLPPPPITSPAPSASPPPVSSTVTATLLGQTGEDIAGTTSETPDGIKDDHIRLNGVQSPVTGVKITDNGGCCAWQTPYNSRGDWIVAIRPQTDPSIVDLYFDVWQLGASYTVNLTFADGSSQTVQTSTAVASAVQLSKKPATTVLSNAISPTANQSALTVNPVTNIGIFRPDTGEWLLDRNGNGQADGCAVDTCIRSFGQTGDLPVTKNINDLNETVIGIFRQGSWLFDSNGSATLDNCSVDECDDFGTPGDLPVTGDWNGSGTERIGVYRPSTGEWLLDMNGNGQWEGCGVDKCFGPFGADGDLPIVGDWNGTGKVGIGIFRPSTGEWFLDMNGNGQWDGCSVDRCFGPFGAAGDLPIAGDWNGTGKVEIGIFRPGTGDWLLDINGNGKFDGCAIDVCLGPLGQPGGLPVVGKW